MPTIYKVLAQSNPTVTTNTNIYTVPSATASVLSTITICNQTTSQQSYRIAIRPGGATLAAQHYIAFDVPIQASDTTALTLGITLAATDVVTIYASSGSMSFSLFGSEIS
jgi:hypothetical protein